MLRATFFVAAVALLASQAAAHCNYQLGEEETLFSVSKGYKLDLPELIANNPQIKNPDEVLEGQIIRIPCGTPVKRGSNLFDLLEHRNDTFLLAEAIAAAGLESELRKIKKSTLFAPTDAAFEALLEDLNIEPEALFNNTELLTSVLQFHIVDGAIKAADLEDGQEVETFLEGQGFNVSKGPNGVTLTTPAGKVVKVIQADLKAGSNVVHLIDQVLVPQEKPTAAAAATEEAAPAPAAAVTPAKLPASCKHAVKEGDTLFTLSKKYGVSVEQLAKLNNLTNKDLIKAGSSLKLC